MKDDRLIRWGVLGTGVIARQFADELARANGSSLVGVASRSAANAKNFANRFPNCRGFDSYETLCSSDEIDVVYIATPTQCHLDHGLMAFANDKAVLCEKPFTKNLEQAQTLITAAENRFCMEAMWMRFNPVIKQVNQAIVSGHIGRVVSTQMAVGYAKSESSSVKPDEGRGAMQAFGCYAISLALYLFGKPNQATGLKQSNSHSTDQTVSATLAYEEHLVSFQASTEVELSNEVRIQGTKGFIAIHSPFIDATSCYISTQPPTRSLLQKIGGKLVGNDIPRVHQCKSGIGFTNEILEVNHCLKNDLSESPTMPKDDTIEVHRIIQELLN